MNTAHVSTLSLLIASSLVLVSLGFSCTQKLKLERETLISIVRAIVQLVAVGYILTYLFKIDNPLVTTLIVLFMVFNAAWNAAGRGKKISHGLLISFFSIAAGAGATLAVLVASGAIRYVPNQIVPISGMIVSNAMVALGLCYRQMAMEFQSRREEVETRLALGADILPASIDIIRTSIRTGMLPTIDSAKTLGIVSLPGMMTGLILAGVSPVQAIRYQILVTFMLLSTTAIASFIACYLCYRGFYNSRKQLR
ncbi:MAG: iron export ABC transporter permease subunit FetB [Ethanoligenens sp.]|uniref:ABC transporter permease n=1 Tax=Ethanoligenens sp. TaxID=2099655 RepID=UPI0039E9EEE9